MHKAEYTFSQKTVNCYFDADFAGIKDLMQDAWTVIITDENLYNLHAEKLAGYRVIQIAAGEEYKNQFTVDSIIEELLLMGANKNTFLIGLCGSCVYAGSKIWFCTHIHFSHGGCCYWRQEWY